MVFLYKGDNIEVLKKEKIKANIIYLDPPYNTKNNKLSYNDNYGNGNIWKNYFTKLISQINDKNSNENSVFFLSIGNDELANSLISMNDVLGKNNFIAIMPRLTQMVSKTTKTISRVHDYVVIYKKGNITFNGIEINKDSYKLKDEHYRKRGLYQLRRLEYKDFKYSRSMDFFVNINEIKYYPMSKETYIKRKLNHKVNDWCWIWSKNKIDFALENDFIEIKNNRLWKKTYTKCEIKRISIGVYELLHHPRTKPLTSIDFTKNRYANNSTKDELEKHFTYPKADRLINDILELPNFEKKIVLDPFGGSGITARKSYDKKYDCHIIQRSEKIPKNSITSEKYNNLYDLTKDILKKNINSKELKIYE